MLQSLEALNPFRWCFSATDYDDTLIEIEAILRTVTPMTGTEIALLDTAEKKQRLEKAYALAALCLNESGKHSPDKQLAFLFGDILWQYARECYEDSYIGSKQVLLAAANLHLYSIGLQDTCIDMRDFSSLEDLKHHGEKRLNLFASTEHLISSIDPDRYVSTAYTSTLAQSYPQRRMLSLAQTLRWLGHCYQNLDQTKTVNTENDRLFEHLFTTSESILLLADSELSKQALGDLYFRAWPFLHQRKQPNDTDGICALYDKALAYDDSKYRQAQVAQKHFQTLFAAGRMNEALVQIHKAIAMAKTLEDSEPVRFMLADLYHDYASYCLSPETLELDIAEINLNRAVGYADQRREAGADHLNFALYDIQFAEFKIVKGEFKEARMIAEHALETLRKHPQSQQPHIYKAEALKSYLEKSLAALST